MPSSVTAVNDSSDASGWHYRPYRHRPAWRRVSITTGTDPVALQVAVWRTFCKICGSVRDAYSEEP